ncbi:Uncharacterised protein [uncultured Eubacterium sp.]|nr:Uncharacterised protein [uncultured Eubacterium sp.]
MSVKTKCSLNKARTRAILIGILCVCFVLIPTAFTGCSDGIKTEPDNSPFEMSVPLSFEKLVSHFATIQKITENEAKGRLRKMNVIANQDATFQIASKTVEVDADYAASLEFYLQTQNEGEEWIITELKGAVVSMRMGSEIRTFVGNLAYWLRGGKQIEYSLNGDFISADLVDSVTMKTDIKQKNDGETIYVINRDTKGLESKYVYQHKTISLND